MKPGIPFCFPGSDRMPPVAAAAFFAAFLPDNPALQISRQD